MEREAGGAKYSQRSYKGEYILILLVGAQRLTQINP